VNEDWLVQFRGWVYGAGFGFQLGLGVITIVTISAVYAVLLAAVMTGSPAGGALIGLAFGLVRGATILGAARIRHPEQLLRLDATLRRWDRPSRRLAIAAEVALALVLLTLVIAP
jgi:sulfite exporter TauE/SafE